ATRTLGRPHRDRDVRSRRGAPRSRIREPPQHARGFGHLLPDDRSPPRRPRHSRRRRGRAPRSRPHGPRPRGRLDPRHLPGNVARAVPRERPLPRRWRRVLGGNPPPGERDRRTPPPHGERLRRGVAGDRRRAPERGEERSPDVRGRTGTAGNRNTSEDRRPLHPPDGSRAREAGSLSEAPTTAEHSPTPRGLAVLAWL